MLVADVSLAEEDMLPSTHPAPPAEWGTHTHTCGPAAPPWSCAVAQALAPCMFQLCPASVTANAGPAEEAPTSLQNTLQSLLEVH